MKICRRCKIEKPLQDYYIHNKMSDGHLNVCKECVKLRVDNREKKLRLENPQWVEQEKIRAREKYYRLQYKLKKPSYESKKRTILRYKEKYPEKQLAKNAIANMVKKDGYNLHHWSYNREHFKDVIELEFKTHMKYHRYLKYDTVAKMYRTIEGELLDSKEKHQKYLTLLDLL